MKFVVQDDHLAIILEGFEKVWALKSRLVIPKHALAEVDYRQQQSTMQDLRGYVRFPGTRLPGMFLAGSYVRRHGREFWYLHMHQAGELALTFKAGAFGYDKIRVSCTPEIAQTIADWWRGALEHKPYA